MNMNEYQMRALETFGTGNETTRSELIARVGFGLCGESGEVAEAIKKYLRGDYEIGMLSLKVRSELGDVLWYIAILAEVFQLDLADVATENLSKLSSRQERGVIQGSGSDR